ncbi:MAG: sigma-70 family RNA polymerase sigma factor [Flavobacteriales bacterium]|nr:sigma-70 family RNA polymerase sigma factor [Flavobacteriales bacterium]
MTDQELADSCLKGNRESQYRLYKMHAGKMMSVCMRYANSREEAEDILQEGFIKVFEKMGQWSGSGALGGWIRTIMVNTALNQIRKDLKWKNSTSIDKVVNLDSEEMTVLGAMNADDLMGLVNKMPTGYKTVFNLFAIEGYSHKEIAEKLEISENTSKTQFFKAKDWMRKAMVAMEKSI